MALNVSAKFRSAWASWMETQSQRQRGHSAPGGETTGSHTPVVIPTPPTEDGALEVTVWAAGCFAKALVTGGSVHGIAGDAKVVSVTKAGEATLSCAGQGTLSFSAAM